MRFVVKYECPQCGAPLEMDELDRLLSCPYCQVRSFLFSRDYFRLVLPHNAPHKDLIYAPYLRFKGAVYYCQGMGVKYRLLDITNAGAELESLPFSLGLKTQALKMRFITPEIPGSFLKFTLDQDEIVARAGKISTSGTGEPVFHRACIGETLSLIYFPMYLENNQLCDAIVNRPIADLKEDASISGLTESNPQWRAEFLATLCPQCGWDLQGEKDSVVLTCSNCDTAWSAAEGKLVQVPVRSVPDRVGNSLNLPFWKISAIVSSSDIMIETFADFIRQTGLSYARAVQPEWENKELNFWIPAFKIHPKVFLHLSYRITLTLQAVEMEEVIPEDNAYPVTLPESEAMESLKVVFANATAGKYRKDIYPQLPKITFQPKGATLVYLPFTETAMEMTQQQSGVTFWKATLKIGRAL